MFDLTRKQKLYTIQKIFVTISTFVTNVTNLICMIENVNALISTPVVGLKPNAKPPEIAEKTLDFLSRFLSAYSDYGISAISDAHSTCNVMNVIKIVPVFLCSVS